MGSLLLYLGSWKRVIGTNSSYLLGNPHFSYTRKTQLLKSIRLCRTFPWVASCLPRRLVWCRFKCNAFNGRLSLCALGYHGLYCEEEYNECLSAPCLNAATCRDLVNGYECVCLAEYKGEWAPLGLLVTEWPIGADAFLNLNAYISNWSMKLFRIKIKCWRWDDVWGEETTWQVSGSLLINWRISLLPFPPCRSSLLSVSVKGWWSKAVFGRLPDVDQGTWLWEPRERDMCWAAGLAGQGRMPRSLAREAGGIWHTGKKVNSH